MFPTMRAFKVFHVVCISLFLYRSFAVPIGRVLGCGKEDPNLTPEQRKYCCESFSLDCEENKPTPSGSDNESSTESHATRSTIYEKLVSRRKLGAPCKEPYFSCAVGLECRSGLCRRVHTREHLEGLLKRGRDVEREERMDLEEFVPYDPSRRSKQEGQLTFRGQSVSAEDVASDRIKGNIRHGGKWAERIRPDEGNDNEESSIFEEDEVAANIADLLATKLHMQLNATQVSGIRDVIAGTLDERAEREDQVDRTEPSKDGIPSSSVQLAGGQTEHVHNHTCSARLVEI